MKVSEILKEAGLPDGTLKQYPDYEQSPDSPENLDYALKDMAVREVLELAENPTQYFAQRGERIQQPQADEISSVLSSVDDKTLELIGNSPMVQRAVEDNYNPEIDKSYIPIDVALEVIQKLSARAGR